MRPIASYGGGNSTFAICPVIRSAISEAGVENVTINKTNEFTVTVAGKTINVTTSTAGDVYVYDLAGKMVASQSVVEGETSIDLNDVAGGVYVIKGPQGNAQKVIVK